MDIKCVYKNRSKPKTFDSANKVYICDKKKKSRSECETFLKEELVQTFFF